MNAKIGDKDEKLRELAMLLIECRDALPALREHHLRLYGIRRDLADRIDTVIREYVVAGLRDK